MANPLLIIGLLGVGGLLLLSASEGSGASAPRKASWQKVKGLPTGRGLTWKLEGAVPVAYLDGIPLRQLKPMNVSKSNSAPYGALPGWTQTYTADEQWNLERWARYSRIMADAFAERRKALPADANKTFIDKYSKELYVPPVLLLDPTPADIAGRTPSPIDEYGRLKPGKYGSGGATFGPMGLLESLENLYANPLGAAVINIAVIAGTGGAGVVAIGAYNMWQARGAEFTLENVALQSARAYVVSQCGEACGMAFDFGVGVARGEDVDVAAENALLKQMTPEQRAAYDEGKKLYNEVA